MNIDPKSETQKPDFKAKAFEYSSDPEKLSFFKRVNAENAFVAGADYAYAMLQSENQRLTEENGKLKEYSDNEIQKLQRLISRYSNQDVVISNNQVQIDRLTKINEELVSFLRSLHDGPMSWDDRKKLYNLLEKC